MPQTSYTIKEIYKIFVVEAFITAIDNVHFFEPQVWVIIYMIMSVQIPYVFISNNYNSSTYQHFFSGNAHRIK